MQSIEMKQTKYRVEAFIIPVGNQFCDREKENAEDKVAEKQSKQVEEECGINKSPTTDEEKLPKTKLEDAFPFVETESLQNLKNSLLLNKIIDSSSTKCDKSKEESLSNDNVLEFPTTKSSRSAGGLKTAYSSHFFNRISTLVSIDEKGEDSDERLTDFCHHGCRNGCSAVVPSPQEVSEKVFKENWLKRLEMLKEKETALKNREAILQSRERALFRREREVRIIERHFREKLKHVEQYISRNKISEGIPKCEDKGSQSFATEIVIQGTGHTNNVESQSCNQDTLKETSHESKSSNTVTVQNEKSQSERTVSLKSSSSSSSTDSNATDERRKKKSVSSRSSTTQKPRKPVKLNYEDLDTTLSADVGDYSFVQTSQKFNPEVYRRPFAFTRSASERRPKSMDRGHGIGENRKEDLQHPGIEQERILKKVTENISASQDKNTKYQNYGLIDRNVNKRTEESKDDKRYSYLNLETTGKLVAPGYGKSSKDRPISWNAETNEWLQKKRHAYNMTSKKSATKDFEDKENVRHENKTSKQERSQKKTDIRSRILTIFR